MSATQCASSTPGSGLARGRGKDPAGQAWQRWLRTAPQISANSTGGRALLISYEFPPVGGSGVQRPAKLVKYLHEFGWEIEVLTAGHNRFLWKDETLARDVPPQVRVHRIPGWEPACVAATLAGPVRHLPFQRAGAWADWLDDRFYWRLTGLSDRIGYGQGEQLWTPAAVRAAMKLQRQRPFDVLITTGPPRWVHEVGLRLARRSGLPWVAELRDPMVTDIDRTAPPGRVDKALQELERGIIQHAAAMVTTCPSLTRDLLERYPDRRPESIHTITNGFDRDDLLACIEPLTSGADADECVLVHAGACYGRIEVARLVRPLQKLLERRPEWRGRVRLELLGLLDREQTAYWQQHRPDWLKLRGYVEHDRAIRRVLEAACSVVMRPDCRHGRLAIPGKLFELLALPTPILGLVPPGGDSDVILREAGGATLAPFEDTPAIEAALEQVIEARLAGDLYARRDWQVVDRYDRRTIAARFAECLESARGAGR